ncbi:MAG: trypsin-like peptidase domain-containing protein [Alphaproteobacteria bacterium]|nr:trypsin-like peptidase domain-containing protein [Alphaproteobacteria bacterium]MCB9796101.1 trypsin-like peptidase domain-containing protein [Alphaproteobacteria bacterium]
MSRSGVPLLLLCLALWPARGLVPVSAVEDAVVAEAARALVAFPGGSGFLISPEGHVLTNAHVAARFGAAGVVIQEPRDPNPRWAERVFVSEAWDLAIYKAEVDAPLPWIPLCGAAPEVGQRVAVVGHLDPPLPRVSFGRVLRVGTKPDGRPALEYDAQTDWGSSGSPVIDQAGTAVGMHRAWDAYGVSAGAFIGVPLCEALEALPELRGAAGG